jgi:hypothetical protein
MLRARSILSFQQTILRLILRKGIPYWRKINRDCDPRKWSNDNLRSFAPLFSGRIINVSGGTDQDKEGGYYRDYFCNSKSYEISNHSSHYGIGEILDLVDPLEPHSPMIERYDVVFNHTVLEHIYEFEIAIANLCKLTRDIVITVVPFLQSYHEEQDLYRDYWRFSPYALAQKFLENGLETIYLDWNNDPFGNLYLFHISTKHSDNWLSILEAHHSNQNKIGPGAFRQQILSNDKNTNLNRATIGDLTKP